MLLRQVPRLTPHRMLQELSNQAVIIVEIRRVEAFVLRIQAGRQWAAKRLTL